jgi:DNA primase small subunit
VVKRYFKEYYFRHGSRIKSPSKIEAREFGYMPFGGIMIRHLSFKDIGALRAVLVKEVPAGVYCSNSLYEDPTAEMHLKGWNRAELIFDIDADALKQPCKKIHDIWLCKGCGKREFGLRPQVCPSCKSNRLLELSWACPSCLEAAKNEALKLMDFLEFDFGIVPREMKTYFSGNAGYHVSVESSAYETLDTHGRAEIADYLCGRGLDPAMFVTQKLAISDPGWRGRMARYIRDLPPDDSVFKSGTSYESRLGEFLNDFTKKQKDLFVNRFLSDTSIKLDSMVTTDVHRIFRIPETLNNKTGLVKRECSHNLHDFNPSIEAIALKDEDEQVKVFVDMCPKVELGGKSYGPFISKTEELPLYAAVYIVSKGAGKFIASEHQEKSLEEKVHQF